MKPKILCILHIPPPINGAALVGKFIKESKIINGQYDVDYINLTTSFDLQTIGKGGIAKIITILKIQFGVLKALFSKKYDLCYMTLTAKGAGFYKDFLIVILLKIFKKNIVYHFHNKGVSQNSDKAWKRYLYRTAFKNTKSILLSPTLYYDIADYVDKADVYFCPNGMPDIAPTKAPTIKRDVYGPSRFLFLSNMMIEKGVMVLLKACQLLKKRNSSIECHFVGAWSDFTEGTFNKVVEEYGLKGSVFAHGKKYNQDKLEFFHNADVFVFPTYYHNECFPLVLIEAMQVGLPIVSTPEGGIPDLVLDGETGFLIPQKDVLALADHLQLLVDNYDKRLEMGLNGRKRYEELFTLSKFEENISSIFRHAILNRKAVRN